MTHDPPETVVVRVPAKVNLELRVGPLRDDGFHSLSTVYHAVGITDEVTASLADGWGVTVRGADAHLVPADESNLALRAAQALAQAYEVIDRPVRLVIDKSIPVAGGMAGGSADAAAALVACDALWGLGCTQAELELVGAGVGSDVPFLVAGGTALGSGRGEQVVPVLAGGSYEWVFALHERGLSTAGVYAELDRLRGAAAVPEPEPSPQLMAALRGGDPRELAGLLVNDLAEAACSLEPTLRTTLEAGVRHGALSAVVSGSGPTVAFLAADRTAALDLMVSLSADGVADRVLHASGPVPGAHLVDAPAERAGG